MSRSYKKHPHHRVCNVPSDKQDKRVSNKKIRRKETEILKEAMKENPEDIETPIFLVGDEVHNVYSWASDTAPKSKVYVSPEEVKENQHVRTAIKK